MENELDALKLSIKRWEDVVESKTYSNGVDTCALCIYWANRKNINIHNEDEESVELCSDCIITKYTNEPGCNNTPYTRFTDAVEDKFYDCWRKSYNIGHSIIDDGYWVLGYDSYIEAKKMLNLLNEILANYDKSDNRYS